MPPGSPDPTPSELTGADVDDLEHLEVPVAEALDLSGLDGIDITAVPSATPLPDDPSFLHRQMRIRPRVLVALAAFALLGTAAKIGWEPSGYGTTIPGPAPELTANITGPITDPGFGSHGKIHFTTVEVDELRWYEWAWKRIRGRDDEIVALYETTEHSAVAAYQQMDASKQVAAVVADSIVNGGSVSGSGARVVAVAPGSPAADAGIVVGDVITDTSNGAVGSPTQLVEAVTASEGEALTVTISDMTGPRALELTPEHVDGAWRVGVEVAPVVDETSPFDVDTAGIGGASGGLMFTLAFIDATSAGDLTADTTIAGTGAIEPDGTVGPISGIERKVIGAHRTGATVFFAPELNAKKAQASAPDGLEVVAVDTVDDALDWLCDHGATDNVCENR